MDLDHGIVALVFAALGLVAYSVACAHHRVWPRLAKILEAMGFGAATALGLHLSYCAFFPASLCSIVHTNGRPVEEPELHIRLEHRSEVFAGGVLTAVASLYSLGWVCRKPTHHH
jgi:hypothetical protein